jgi:hypothetical protein
MVRRSDEISALREFVSNGEQFIERAHFPGNVVHTNGAVSGG